VANLSILGDILLNEEKWEEAASVYEKYWELDLRDPSVLYLSGLAWGKAGDSAKASKAKKRARLLPLGNATKRLQLAETMYDRGDRESAIEEWKLVARTADVNGWDSSIALQHLAREIYEEDPGTAA